MGGAFARHLFQRDLFGRRSPIVALSRLTGILYHFIAFGYPGNISSSFRSSSLRRVFS